MIDLIEDEYDPEEDFECYEADGFECGWMDGWESALAEARYMTLMLMAASFFCGGRSYWCVRVLDLLIEGVMNADVVGNGCSVSVLPGLLQHGAFDARARQDRRLVRFDAEHRLLP